MQAEPDVELGMLITAANPQMSSRCGFQVAKRAHLGRNQYQVSPNTPSMNMTMTTAPTIQMMLFMTYSFYYAGYYAGRH